MSDKTYPKVRLETDHGEMTLELWDDVAPKHAENFLKLVDDGFYDGLTFHRIIPKFVIQGGCPRGDGTGGPGWRVNAEFNDRPHEKGVLSMARSADPNSAGSQFFVCLTREHCQHLDGQYTAFGKVVDGLNVVDELASSKLADPSAGRPANPPTITKASRIDD
ncbi:MAG: peptidylprolyl isomerase [Phycisphaerales bacterium]